MDFFSDFFSANRQHIAGKQKQTKAAKSNFNRNNRTKINLNHITGISEYMQKKAI